MKLKYIITSLLTLLMSSNGSGQGANSSKYVNSQFKISIELHNHIQETKTRIFFDNTVVKVLKKQEFTTSNSDSTLFLIHLNNPDNLDIINRIQPDSFKLYYLNPCIDDGFSLEIFLFKNGINKHVILDNFYQDDIGEIISFVNQKVPGKYKIPYNKKELVSDYRKCEEIQTERRE